MTSTDLSKFDNSWYKPGAGAFTRFLWYYANAWILNSSWLPVSQVKVGLLRIFGARVGKKVIIKPSVNVKYPWRLTIGDYAWIGENVWIDNLDDVTIGAHCCVSQGVLLLCGNHNYKSETFDLVTGKIVLEDGVWIGANATVCPGAVCKSHSVLAVGSVATKDMEENGVYQGVPAVWVRSRAVI
jgi:putative colanic acid biosynthesis acetyltransferase WcaF